MRPLFTAFGLLALLGGALGCAPTTPRDGALTSDVHEFSPELTFVGTRGLGVGKHVVLVAGDEEYRSEETLPALAKILAAWHGFRCTVLFSLDETDTFIDPDARGNIPGLAALDDADLLVIFTRFRRLPDADMKHLVDYVESGRPLLGIRTATHAFAYEGDSTSPYAHWGWNSADWDGGFGRQILGETWVAHHGRHGSESTRGVIPDVVASHPILRGVDTLWGPTDVYAIRNLPRDAQVLVRGAVLDSMSPDGAIIDDARNDPMMPIVWTRRRVLADGSVQRIVGSTIGASVDFADEGVRRTLVNACYWLAGLEDGIAAISDVRLVGDFKPTMFGFGGAVKGLRPSDHAKASP